MDIEKEYVRKVYNYLAMFSAASCQNRTQKKFHRWVNVQKFVDQLPPGSVVIDVGCGESKYFRNDCFVMGCDVCLEILTQLQSPASADLQLADALHLPYRSGSIDAALLVSVLHHFTTLDRRKQVLAEVTRCLRFRGRILIYVWAFEQPSGVFPSQNVLVPWYLHDNVRSGKHPLVKFHMDSTKEERIIRDSIAIGVRGENARNGYVSWYDRIYNLFGFVGKPSRHLPPAVPNKNKAKAFCMSTISIRRWKPSFTRMRLNVIEQFSEKFAECIIELALMEALSTEQKVTFYRFYHVFKKGELETLIAMLPSLRLLRLGYEHANWWAIAEKADVSS